LLKARLLWVAQLSHGGGQVGRVIIQLWDSLEDNWWGGDCCMWHQLYCGRDYVGRVTIESWHLGCYTLK